MKLPETLESSSNNYYYSRNNPNNNNAHNNNGNAFSNSGRKNNNNNNMNNNNMNNNNNNNNNTSSGLGQALTPGSKPVSHLKAMNIPSVQFGSVKVSKMDDMNSFLKKSMQKVSTKK